MAPKSDPIQRSRMLEAAAEAVVSVTRTYTGRGAERARAMLDRDLLSVLMRDVLTRGEQVLVDGGRAEEVMAIRRTFQQAMSPELVGQMEDITGRRVEAFMSANHLDPDYSLESFVLGEAIGPGDSRGQDVSASAVVRDRPPGRRRTARALTRERT